MNRCSNHTHTTYTQWVPQLLYIYIVVFTNRVHKTVVRTCHVHVHVYTCQCTHVCNLNICILSTVLYIFYYSQITV